MATILTVEKTNVITQNAEVDIPYRGDIPQKAWVRAAARDRCALLLSHAELRTLLADVRDDIWRSQLHSSQQRQFDILNEAVAKLDAVLGTVSDTERLERFFPGLRSVPKDNPC